MKRISLFCLIFSSSCLFAQDFTSSISKMAFANGETYGNLKRCNAPAESLIIFEEIIHNLKAERLPIDSYIELYDKFYEEGKQSVLSKASDKPKGCEEYLESAKELILYDEKNS